MDIEIIHFGTRVKVKGGFCGYEFHGIVMDSLALHVGHSNSFLDSTMYRVAELLSIGPERYAIKKIHQWVPCELMLDHDESQTAQSHEILNAYCAREVDTVAAMCAERLEGLRNDRDS